VGVNDNVEENIWSMGEDGRRRLCSWMCSSSAWVLAKIEIESPVAGDNTLLAPGEACPFHSSCAIYRIRREKVTPQALSLCLRLGKSYELACFAYQLGHLTLRRESRRNHLRLYDPVHLTRNVVARQLLVKVIGEECC